VYSLDLRSFWVTVIVGFTPPVTGLGVGTLVAAVGRRFAADGGDGGGWASVATETAVVNSASPALTKSRINTSVYSSSHQ